MPSNLGLEPTAKGWPRLNPHRYADNAVGSAPSFLGALKIWFLAWESTLKGTPPSVETHTEWVCRPAWLPHRNVVEHRSASRGAIGVTVTGGVRRAWGSRGSVATPLHNLRLQATVGVGLPADRERPRSPTAPEPHCSATWEGVGT